MGLWKRWLQQSPRARFRHSARPQLEALESRIVPYTTVGDAWPHPQLITISFVPDGTNLGGVSSNLFSVFDAKFGSAATWENVILKAAQVWAQQTNINFAVVSDDGVGIGGGNYEQGDPNMGDIRIGGFNFDNNVLAYGEYPPPGNNYSIAGDIQFNTALGYNIGTTFDLFTVAAHEFGHALGLAESTASSSAIMWGTYVGIKKALTSDDIAGIQSLYGGARAPDQYNTGGASNSTFATAANISSLINTTTLTAQVTGLDIQTTSTVEYFSFVAPSGTNGTLTVQVQSQGLSLLTPDLYVYNASQTLLGSASGAGQYGTTLNVTVSGITAGATYYVEVTGADSTAFSTGDYALTLNLGTGPMPTVPLPNTETPDGSPLHNQGGANDNLPGTVLAAELATPVPFFTAAPSSSQGVLLPLAIGTGVAGTPVPALVVSPPIAGVSTAAASGPAAPLPGLSSQPVLDSCVDSGGGENLVQAYEDQVPDAMLEAMPPVTEAAVPSTPAPAAPEAPAATLPQTVLWRAASTAWFAQESARVRLTDRPAAASPSAAEDGAPALDSGAAAAALAVVLGGYWGRLPEATASRRRRPVLR